MYYTDHTADFVLAGLVRKEEEKVEASLDFLLFLLKKHLYEFTPIDVSKMLDVTNKTIINRSAGLCINGFLVPVIVKERIRSYKLSDFAKMNEKKLLKQLETEYF